MLFKLRANFVSLCRLGKLVVDVSDAYVETVLETFTHTCCFLEDRRLLRNGCCQNENRVFMTHGSVWIKQLRLAKMEWHMMRCPENTWNGYVKQRNLTAELVVNQHKKECERNKDRETWLIS